MTEEELKRPIHIERFHIMDHTGIYHRIQVSVEVGLDEQAYVTYPRVTKSNVSAVRTAYLPMPPQPPSASTFMFQPLAPSCGATGKLAEG